MKIAAFGALNQDSYDMFREHLRGRAELVCAGPYPNAAAVSAPGRPLRAEALQDEDKRQELLLAVAADVNALGAADVLCMPCMSMIGFHDDIERTLGKKIVSLADALAARYKTVGKLGVIHMRPAKQRIVEIFGDKAVTPDDLQAARLLEAENAAKLIGNAAPVEAVMKEIAEAWRNDGLLHILFARADAPCAEKSAAKIPGVAIDSHFGILAEAICAKSS